MSVSINPNKEIKSKRKLIKLKIRIPYSQNPDFLSVLNFNDKKCLNYRHYGPVYRLFVHFSPVYAHGLNTGPLCLDLERFKCRPSQ